MRELEGSKRDVIFGKANAHAQTAAAGRCPAGARILIYRTERLWPVQTRAGRTSRSAGRFSLTGLILRRRSMRASPSLRDHHHHHRRPTTGWEGCHSRVRVARAATALEISSSLPPLSRAPAFSVIRGRVRAGPMFIFLRVKETLARGWALREISR